MFKVIKMCQIFLYTTSSVRCTLSHIFIFLLHNVRPRNVVQKVYKQARTFSLNQDFLHIKFSVVEVRQNLYNTSYPIPAISDLFYPILAI